MKKALIAMSGGVDSSVAALRMREAGWTCIGVHLRLFDGPGPEGGCCSLESAEDARSVAYRLGMPFYVFNFTREFTDSVIAPFAAAYRRGETPNPCLACNRHIKFGALLRRARELGCDEPVRRGAPGQTAAVYRNGEVLGGGVMIRGAPPPERTDSPLAKPP